MIFGNQFTGSVDDIGMWNRALTDCEIATMYLNNEIITTQPQNSNGLVNNSAQITITAGAGSTFQWQTDNGTGFQNITNAGQYSGVNTNTLNVSNLNISNNNNQQFKCIVNFGECPSTSNSAVLTVTDPSSIEEQASANQFSVYPNPASSNATINVNPKMINSTYVILTATGKEVMSGTIKKEITNIDLSSFSSGVYTVQLAGKLNKKIIVTK